MTIFRTENVKQNYIFPVYFKYPFKIMFAKLITDDTLKIYPNSNEIGCFDIPVGEFLSLLLNKDISVPLDSEYKLIYFHELFGCNAKKPRVCK